MKSQDRGFPDLDNKLGQFDSLEKRVRDARAKKNRGVCFSDSSQSHGCFCPGWSGSEKDLWPPVRKKTNVEWPFKNTCVTLGVICGIVGVPTPGVMLPIPPNGTRSLCCSVLPDPQGRPLEGARQSPSSYLISLPSLSLSGLWRPGARSNPSRRFSCSSLDRWGGLLDARWPSICGLC